MMMDLPVRRSWYTSMVAVVIYFVFVKKRELKEG